MAETGRTYIAIDLKSFYASVECIERGLDPMNTNLIVADASRTDKTICLAVSPSLKAYGISGRARLFEVIQKCREVNRKRQQEHGPLLRKSVYADELAANPSLAVGYITAPPRMAYYIEYSAMIYRIYLKYIAPEDIHVYSIDEVFIDASHYLKNYRMTARELAETMIREVLVITGITATAGIGTNLYLCKVAMDIVAKHIPADKNGVRIAELDEKRYRELLWDHRPLTDFWRVGQGYAGKLEACGLYTMGDIARCSLGKSHEFYNEDLLYRLFGINAELLIDHAWGIETCTMEEIKSYKPSSNSLGSGQVLHRPYDWKEARIVLQEMAEQLSLDLVKKNLVSDQIVLTVGYDIENLTDKSILYKGEIKIDHYGRKVPKHAHGTARLKVKTASTVLIVQEAVNLYEKIINRTLKIRRINITACNVENGDCCIKPMRVQQLDLFSDVQKMLKEEEWMKRAMKNEKELQLAILTIKRRYGKNAVLKGLNLLEGATAIERNGQIGGHKA